LAPDERSERVEILPGLLPLKNIFGAEISDLDTKIGQESESVQKMEERRGEEIERGRRKIICLHELLEQAKMSGGSIPFYKILEAVQKIEDNWTEGRSKMLWLDELIKQAKVSGELIPLNKTPEAVQEIEDEWAEKMKKGREKTLSGEPRDIIYKAGALPVYTKTPRMLIAGKIIAY
jgi:hypothetical protein